MTVGDFRTDMLMGYTGDIASDTPVYAVDCRTGLKYNIKKIIFEQDLVTNKKEIQLIVNGGENLTNDR